MNSTVVEVDETGRVRLEHDPEFAMPTLQERRAIIYSAKNEIEALTELIEKLESQKS
jgi:hypothetical protein